METEFLTQFTELLERETPVLMEDIFREYDNWDSLAYLSVISFVDEEYDVIIPKEKFGQMKSIADIYAYVAEHKN